MAIASCGLGGELCDALGLKNVTRLSIHAAVNELVRVDAEMIVTEEQAGKLLATFKDRNFTLFDGDEEPRVYPLTPNPTPADNAGPQTEVRSSVSS